MSVFNALVFDGINSLNYGVYITGEAVFNSPQRSVEAVTVPGRNGDVLLDLGRYENIEVTYHAGVFGADQSEFATKIRTFRNLLASRVGYKRITDTYNPNEYRMGTFIASVDVTPTSMDRHGEFDIVFNCKPQRFLTSGETAITVTNGNTVTNPTLFDSQPLLAVKGYGNIDMGGYEISLQSGYLGEVQLFNSRKNTWVPSGTIPTSHTLNCGDADTYDTSLVNNGDDIKLSATFQVAIRLTSSGDYWNSMVVSPTPTSTATWTTELVRSNTGKIKVNFANEASNWLSAGSSNSKFCTQTVTLTSKNGSTTDVTMTCTILSNNNKVYATFAVSEIGTGLLNAMTINLSEVVADSTISRLGNPTYLDCETGEAYKVENNTVVGLNSFIAVGADLPVLAPGANTITYDNTVSELKITPRWWQL